MPKVESLSIDLFLLGALRWESSSAPAHWKIMADWIAGLGMSSCSRILLRDVVLNRIK